MLRAIVFDFDGVIADSEPLHCRAYREILADEGVDLVERDYYERYLGYSDAEGFRTIAADRGLAWTADRIAGLVSRKAERLEQLERDTPVLFPGAEAAVRRAAAVVPLAIASGALRAEIVRVLDRANLTGSFAAIVAAGDTLASKPAPDPYLRAVTLLSSAAGQPFAAAECVAIEDSRWGIESARAAGLRTVGVLHSYGPADLGAPDLIITDLTALDVTVLHQLCAEKPRHNRPESK